MKKTLSTYKEVAEKMLGKIDGARFIAYMTVRWPGKREESNVLFGYAEEWAERFAIDTEYPSSDLEGLKILRKIEGLE